MTSGNRCMYMAHVCFMSVVVTVWGSVAGMFFCVAAVVKNSSKPWSVVDVCCVFV